jgi:hypothetical protein
LQTGVVPLRSQVAGDGQLAVEPQLDVPLSFVPLSLPGPASGFAAPLSL